jgi:uncharacterized protein (DUF305 family)
MARAQVRSSNPVRQDGRSVLPRKRHIGSRCLIIASLSDIQFLRGMIPHHSKEMSALAEDRTNNTTVLAVAARISLSQDIEDFYDAGLASRSGAR